jgi:hypothetical protein
LTLFEDSKSALGQRSPIFTATMKDLKRCLGTTTPSSETTATTTASVATKLLTSLSNEMTTSKLTRYYSTQPSRSRSRQLKAIKTATRTAMATQHRSECLAKQSSQHTHRKLTLRILKSSILKSNIPKVKTLWANTGTITRIITSTTQLKPKLPACQPRTTSRNTTVRIHSTHSTTINSTSMIRPQASRTSKLHQTSRQEHGQDKLEADKGKSEKVSAISTLNEAIDRQKAVRSAAERVPGHGHGSILTVLRTVLLTVPGLLQQRADAVSTQLATVRKHFLMFTP